MLPLILQPPPKTPTAAATYATKVLALNRAHLLGYWPLWEGTGSVAVDLSGNVRNGAYSACTLGQTGAGDGRTAPTLNGTTSYVNAYTAALAAAFNGAEGTVSLWFKVSGAGVWTDATNRRVIYISASATNRVILFKFTTNNALQWFYQAGNVTKSLSKTTIAPTGWVHLALTWSKSADQMKAYYNGVQEGATQTALGTWAGALLATNTVIGATSTVPTEPWSGSIAHVALFDTPLTAGDITTLATMP